MANPSDLSVPAANHSVTGVIDRGCEFEGKLCFQGTVRINGSFRGQIFTPDTLVIGEEARVTADVEAGVVITSGEVVGNVKARKRVEIHKTAIVRGDVTTPSIKIEEGGKVVGQVKTIVAE